MKNNSFKTDNIFQTPSIYDKQWIQQVKKEEKCAQNWPQKWGNTYLDDATIQSTFNKTLQDQIHQKEMEMLQLPFSKKDTTSNEYGKRKSIEIFQAFDRAEKNYWKSRPELQFYLKKQPWNYFP